MITNKLENRVMNEIVSNVNLSEIDIEEGLFRDDAQVTTYDHIICLVWLW